MASFNYFLGMASGVLIKSIVLSIVVLTFMWFFRKKSAADRHFYLTLTTIALLVLPIVALVLPSWGSGPIPNPFENISAQSAIETSDLKPISQKTNEKTRDSYIRLKNSQETTTGSEYKAKNIARIFKIIIYGWFIGTSLIFIWLIGGKIYCYVIYKKSQFVEDQNILRTIHNFTKRFGLKKHILTMYSHLTKVPVVTGLLYPKLLLPHSVKKWPEEKKEAILFHELAHIKRNDTFFQFLAQIACAFYWFSPLSWILERKLMIERERACDNVVLQQNIKPSSLAAYLMETSEELGSDKNTKWTLAGMAEGTDFKDRILSILDPNAKRMSLTPTRALISGLLSVLIILPLITFSPWHTQAASPIPTDTKPTVQKELKTVPQAGKTEKTEYAQRFLVLIQLLKDKNAEVRANAAKALGDLNDKRAVPGLIDALKDRHVIVRRSAAYALSNIGDERAVPGLINALKDEDAEVRAYAARALGNRGDKRAFPALIKALKDVNANVRRNAAKALGDRSVKSAVFPLIEALKDENAEVRANAAKALGDLNDKRAVPALIEALKDEDPQVRANVSKALGDIGRLSK